MMLMKLSLVIVCGSLLSACSMSNLNTNINFERNYGYDGETIVVIDKPLDVILRPLKTLSKIESEKETNLINNEVKSKSSITKYSAFIDDNKYQINGSIDSDIYLEFVCDFDYMRRSIEGCKTKTDEKDLGTEILNSFLAGLFGAEYNGMFLTEHTVYSGKKGFINSKLIADSLVSTFKNLDPEINPKVEVKDSYYEVLGKAKYKGREVIVVGDRMGMKLTFPGFSLEVVSDGYSNFDLETGHMLSGKHLTYLITNGKNTAKTISRTSLLNIDV